jgi:hypothetical protein
MDNPKHVMSLVIADGELEKPDGERVVHSFLAKVLDETHAAFLEQAEITAAKFSARLDTCYLLLVADTIARSLSAKDSVAYYPIGAFIWGSCVEANHPIYQQYLKGAQLVPYPNPETVEIEFNPTAPNIFKPQSFN